jgi:hypothetical protein
MRRISKDENREFLDIFFFMTRTEDNSSIISGDKDEFFLSCICLFTLWYMHIWIDIMLGICRLQTVIFTSYHVSIFAIMLSVSILLMVGANNTSLAQSSQMGATAVVHKPSNVHNTLTAELSYDTQNMTHRSAKDLNNNGDWISK